MHTALGVFEGQSQEQTEGENEAVQSSRRGGRKGAAQSAQSLDAGAAREGGEAQSQSRVLISQESNRHLDDLAARVNDGFDAGKITRPQILSWVLRRFAEAAGEDEIQELRAAHFDRIAYLEALLKRAKETGVLPPELAAAAQPPCGSAQSQKKSKRSLTKNITNGEIIKDE